MLRAGRRAFRAPQVGGAVLQRIPHYHYRSKSPPRNFQYLAHEIFSFSCIAVGSAPIVVRLHSGDGKERQCAEGAATAAFTLLNVICIIYVIVVQFVLVHPQRNGRLTSGY